MVYKRALSKFIVLFSLFLVPFFLMSCNSQLVETHSTAATTVQATQVKRIAQQDSVALLKENRPNLILILVDDLDLLLNTIDYMPYLQEYFIKQGTTIRDFVVNIPVCCPSRATILRGQYTHNHQTYINESPDGGFAKFFTTEADTSTIATWLQSAGYTTALMGKYLNGYPLKDQREYIPHGWSEWYSPAKGKPYTGFNYTLNENGRFIDYFEEIPENYLTDVLAKKAIDFIYRSADQPTPFFLYLAPYAPHEPARPAPRHAGMFSEITAPKTLSFNEEDVSDKPAWIQTDPPLTQENILVINENYRDRVESMQAVDEMLKELIEALSATNELDHTYLIFTSDNGYHMGQHRQISGKSSAYEEDVIVPLVIRGPDIPVGKSIQGFLASTIDIAPTLAEFAGVRPPAFVDGRSLLPLLGSTLPSEQNWRRAALIEFYGIGELETGQTSGYLVANRESDGLLEQKDPDQVILGAPPPIYAALRTDQYKYIEYYDGQKELYDMVSDPHELENIISSSDPNLIAELSTWLKALQTCSGAQCYALENGPN